MVHPLPSPLPLPPQISRYHSKPTNVVLTRLQNSLMAVEGFEHLTRPVPTSPLHLPHPIVCEWLAIKCLYTVHPVHR